ncbi:MAG: flagellar basal-body MS-ring/collar protein FliF [Bacillota bacterium]
MNPRDLLAQLKRRWQAFNATQKAAVVLAGAGLIAGVFYLHTVLVQLSYAPLFKGLSAEDAGVIVQKLEEMKIPYRLTDGGSTIVVPKREVYKTRANLAASGALTSGGSGFELFDKTRLGVTDFEQQVNYQRALQEELRRSIVQLDEVEQARVHLVIPRKSLFIEEQQKPSASIAVKLKPLAHLKPAQVEGIVALVCGAVEGLRPEDVHVIDMAGNVLSDSVTASTQARAVKTLHDLERAYEQELERRITGVLTKILGPDKAVAVVSADFDFSEQETVTTIAYGEPVVVSEQTLTEQNSAGAAAGVPGTGSNLVPTYPSVTAEGQGYSRQEVTRNYQVGQREEKVIEVPGRLKRLVASVVVDAQLNLAAVKRIENVVAGAIGYNAERGDEIQVASMAFDKSYQKKIEAEMAAAEAKAKKEAQRDRVLTLVKQGVIGLVILVSLLLVIRWLGRVRPAAPRIEEVIPVHVSVPPSQKDERFEKVKETAQKKPEEVADIIRAWLSEE